MTELNDEQKAQAKELRERIDNIQKAIGYQYDKIVQFEMNIEDNKETLKDVHRQLREILL